MHSECTFLDAPSLIFSVIAELQATRRTTEKVWYKSEEDSQAPNCLTK